MNSNFIQSNSAVFAALIISAIFVCGYINLPHHYGMDMGMDKTDNMAPCPQCGRIAFTSATALAGKIMYLIAFFVTTLYVYLKHRQGLILSKLRIPPSFLKFRTKTLKNIFSRILVLFSDGIIHPKIYNLGV